MNPRVRIFARLRRHRTSLGRFVLAMFAGASLVSSAAPCFAMAAEAAPVTAEHVAHPNDTPSGDHCSHSSGATGHGHQGPAAPQDFPGKHCPHCSLSASMPGHDSSAHSFCSVSDASSDQSQPPPSAFFKPMAATIVLEVVPLSSLLHARGVAPLRFSPARAPSVALNVRHCVFLI